MKQLKLEVGKTYRSRKGEEVKIVEKGSKDPYLYKGSNGEWYKENGSFWYHENPRDLIEEVEEVPETRHTFDIPEGVKKVTVEQVGNCIVVEMVPEEVEPKAGDVMINTHGSVYIYKEVKSHDSHRHFAWLGKGLLRINGERLSIESQCIPGRPATPEEAQPLWDALRRAGKRWNAETMEVEEIPEIDRIREWVEEHLDEEDVAEAIEAYLKYREGEK